MRIWAKILLTIASAFMLISCGDGTYERQAKLIKELKYQLVAERAYNDSSIARIALEARTAIKPILAADEELLAGVIFASWGVIFGGSEESRNEYLLSVIKAFYEIHTERSSIKAYVFAMVPPLALFVCFLLLFYLLIQLLWLFLIERPDVNARIAAVEANEARLNKRLDNISGDEQQAQKLLSDAHDELLEAQEELEETNEAIADAEDTLAHLNIVIRRKEKIAREEAEKDRIDAEEAEDIFDI
jgi:hypothetical protein